ncbi:MAG: 4-alpha-glucanotransferase [Thermoanaerobaculia bacterium]
MTGRRTAGVPPRRERAAGLLLHPTSLPGEFPIGDLGPGALAMLDWMVSAGFRVWQVLPLGPTGLGDSPYNSLSAFAGNPSLISPEALVGDGLLAANDLEPWRVAPSAQCDFNTAVRCKESLLRIAFRNFQSGSFPDLSAAVADFGAPARRAAWLDDWALYATLKREYGGISWLDWPAEARRRDARALARLRESLAGEIRFQIFCQVLFFRQSRALRSAAESRGIRILGDVPMYVAPDSADAWSRPELFDLAEDGHPRAVAGVPPDYFSADGQRWGNPLYRWEAMKADGFRWWIARLRTQLEFAHFLRLDHFRGFVAYWRVAAQAKTARRGRWVKGPGEAFFRALAGALGELPLLAEDLGDVDARVHALRRKLDLPGMRVLQFAFGEVDSEHAPHRHEPRCAAYTGTHDNDTTRSWFGQTGDDERRRATAYLGATPETISEAMVRAAYGSVADLALVPLQDVLNLDGAARMNTPGKESGNWTWRVRHSDVASDVPRRLQELASATARLPAPGSLPVSPPGA